MMTMNSKKAKKVFCNAMHDKDNLKAILEALMKKMINYPFDT